MRKNATFEEIIDEMILKPNEARRQAEFEALHPEFVDMEQSVSIMEECMEMMEACSDLSLYDAQYQCANALAFEGERWDKFKEGAKKLWLKIIDAIKKAVKFIISIITWPFRKLIKLISETKLYKNIFGCNNEDIEITTNIAEIHKSAPEILDEVKKCIPKHHAEAKKLNEFIEEIRDVVKDVYYGFQIDILQKMQNDDKYNRQSEYLLDKAQNIETHSRITASSILSNIKLNTKNINGNECVNAVCELLTLSKNVYDESMTKTKQLEGELNELNNKIIEIEVLFKSNKDIKFSNKYREVIQKALNTIRFNINEIAKENSCIAKFFFQMDESIHNIAEIGGMLGKSYWSKIYKKDPYDWIGDVPIFQDDERVLKSGGATTETWIKESPSKPFKLQYVQKAYENHNKNTCIVTSSLIKSWKEDPMKIRWYKHLIGHEYSHHVVYRHAMMRKDALSHLERWSKEIEVDRFGKNISDISDIDIIAMREEMIKDSKKQIQLNNQRLKAKGLQLFELDEVSMYTNIVVRFGFSLNKK